MPETRDIGNIYDEVELLKTQMENVQSQLASMGPVNIVTGQEVATNEKFGGKTVYCKAVDFGALPNATDKDVTSGLNMSQVNVIRVEGTARNSLGVTIPLPNATHASNYTIGCFLTSTGLVRIGTVIDRSDYTAVVRIYYTKNEGA